MIKKKTIVILYFIIAFIYMVAAINHLENIELIFKPIMLPLIIYYYLEKIRKRISYWVLASFAFFYCGEMISLIAAEDYYFLMLLMFLIPYLIYTSELLNEFLNYFKIAKLSMFNLSTLMVGALLIFLLVSVLRMLNIENKPEFVLLLIYGLTLLFMCLLSVGLFMFNDSKSNFYCLLTVIAFIVSDLFYIFNKKIDSNNVFLFVNLVTQILSYYFYTKYYLLKAKKR